MSERGGGRGGGIPPSGAQKSDSPLGRKFRYYYSPPQGEICRQNFRICAPKGKKKIGRQILVTFKVLLKFAQNVNYNFWSFSSSPLLTPSLSHEAVPLPEAIFLPPTLSQFLVHPSLHFFPCPRMSRMRGKSGQCRQRLAVKMSLKIAIY